MEEQKDFQQDSPVDSTAKLKQSRTDSDAQKLKRSEQKRLRRTSRSNAKSNKGVVSTDPKIPADAIPLEKALRLLQDAKVPGLMSRDSLRLAFHSGRLPGYIKGRKLIYLAAGPIFELIGSAPVGDVSVDQALINHYESSEFNTPITAMMAGLVANLGKAHQVFKDWIKLRNDPDVAARIEAKEKADAAKNPKIEEPIVTTCESCNRSPEQADKDDADINLVVTGHKESPNASEMRALSEFQDQKCTGCWKWLPSAPTASMQARLRIEKT